MTDGSGGIGYPPPYGYPPTAHWYAGQFRYGPPGQIRPTGMTVFLFIITFGVYQYFYNYSVHEEMKRHAGRGVGGGVALVLSFFAAIAMPFVTPHEIGNMYALQGQPKPVSAKTGLWIVLPMVGGLIAVVGAFIAVIATATFHDSVDSYGDTTRVPEIHAGRIAAFIAIPLAFVIVSLVSQIIYFTKSNGALNNYWVAMGVRP